MPDKLIPNIDVGDRVRMALHPVYFGVVVDRDYEYCGDTNYVYFLKVSFGSYIGIYNPNVLSKCDTTKCHECKDRFKCWTT